jgi:hypothetical protein
MQEMLKSLVPIMLFYSLLAFFICPGIGYLITKNIGGITFGIYTGCFISILLWHFYGKKMVKMGKD